MDEEQEILVRLWDRVQDEIKYVNKKLEEDVNAPRTTLMLTIMKKRLNRIVEDAKKGGVYDMGFSKETKKLAKL